ncbi:MAG: DUF4091 domain-containing protein [Myxococcales bacterium]|nr:DUF4091 domain-containing protein [Myxococcales bacterium]
MRLSTLTITCVIAAIAVPTSARAELGKVWALDDGTKVKRSAIKHRLARRNGVFDGKAVHLFGARNEIVAFQLMLVGGKRATRGVRVRFEALGSIRNAAKLASGRGDSADRWFIGRPIARFRQHYLTVRERSHDLTWKKRSRAMPRGMKGDIPDALIPLRRTDRFSVPARQNQGVWIDVYIPKGTRAGRQRGTLVVEVGGKPCALSTCTLPVTLDVLDATLPDKPSAKTMLYFGGGDDDRDYMMARYFKDPWKASAKQADALRARHYKLARRHRVTLILGKRKTPDRSLGQRISGRAFTRAAGYEGPGARIGQDVYSIHTFGGKLTHKQARVWSHYFAHRGPHVTYFLYTTDEPSPGQYREVDAIARAARPVPAFVTTSFSPKLPAISIFCALAESYRRADARRARAVRKHQWIYNGVRPFSGTFAIDDVAISPRVNPWIQYKHRIERWFYWESVYYKDFQGKRGNIDVWREPINFTNRHGDRMNGDGLLMYPGRDLVFKKHDRGFDMPLPSIRLKAWRRGIQDVEYLVLATRRGHGAAVKRLLAKLLPRVLDQTRAGQAVSWPEDGERWLAARQRLFQLLARRK